MNTWYYSQADQVVGPFQMEVLGKLLHAGVIDDGTLVRNADAEDWHPLAAVLAAAAASVPAAAQDEARYYYLGADDQPIGPFDAATLRRLYDEKVLTTDTLVSGIGEAEWVPAARLLNLVVGNPVLPNLAATPAADTAPPRSLSFESYALLTALTLGFYGFYLVPSQSRDLKAITGRGRMEFITLLILGIVTFGVMLLVMQVLFAFDLERHGKTVGQAGREESLGLLVLVLSVVSVLLPLVLDGGLFIHLAGALPGTAALWLVQKEINLYAAPVGTTRTA